MLSNLQISELLARAAENHEDDDLAPHARRALLKAARSALTWPVAAWQLRDQGEPLTRLRSVGPYLSHLISGWLADGPPVPEPPELRQGFLSLEQVQATPRCYWPLGDLHAHTDWSDGKASLQEMAEAAEERGYSYLAVTDHAANLKIARGLSEERLRDQGQAIDETNEQLQQRGFRVRLLRSSEINFTPNGLPDYPADVLRGLDFVIGAFHSKLRLTDDQTERYQAALTCPEVDVLAHPRGRIFNHRLGLKADWDTVCQTAARLGKALEIDGIPDRQDMSPDVLAYAVKHDVWVSLGSDAHHPSQLTYLDFALTSAQRAGVRPERILNLLSWDELRRWRAQRLAKVDSLLVPAR